MHVLRLFAAANRLPFLLHGVHAHCKSIDYILTRLPLFRTPHSTTALVRRAAHFSPLSSLASLALAQTLSWAASESTSPSHLFLVALLGVTALLIVSTTVFAASTKNHGGSAPKALLPVIALISAVTSTVCAVFRKVATVGGIATAIAAPAIALYRLYQFTATTASWPESLGLACGILSVVVCQIVVLTYHYCNVWFTGYKGHFLADGRAPRPTPTTSLKSSFAREVMTHLSNVEGLMTLGPYLCVTWMLRLMPAQYYTMPVPHHEGVVAGEWAAGVEGWTALASSLFAMVDWKVVGAQLLCVDLLMFAVHLFQHAIPAVYKRTHKPHHKHVFPTLFDGFSGHFVDTVMLILVPLYATANLIPSNAATYMAFGSAYSSYLLLIHSEQPHLWDPLFRLLGIVTSGDHSVHHVKFVANFGHFVTWWDRLAGTYRHPSSLDPKAAAAAAATATADAAANTNTNADGDAKKQGAYGKVVTHPSGTLKGALTDPRELVAMLRFKYGSGLGGVKKGSMTMAAPGDDFLGDRAALAGDVAFCCEILDRVSRSFAAVIRQLPEELAMPICVFYLALRALDTVEDDMDRSKFDKAAQELGPDELVRLDFNNSDWKVQSEWAPKIEALKCFYKYLGGAEAGDAAPLVSLESLKGCGEADEERLVCEFERVSNVFMALPAGQRAVISDITRRMGCGMASYVSRDLKQGTRDTSEYNTYCHIVAGLVGEGLSRQFSASSLEDIPEAVWEAGEGSLSSDMGLFLQKNNIIRDYLEDLVDGRAFWPHDVWQHYAQDLGDLRLDQGTPSAEQQERSLACLNELIADAITLLPSCVKYLQILHSPGVFRFCAIPQLMALATLQELYDNPKVFTGVVKIRKGLACRLLLGSEDMGSVLQWFQDNTARIAAKATKALKAKQAMMGPNGIATPTQKLSIASHEAVLKSLAFANESIESAAATIRA